MEKNNLKIIFLILILQSLLVLPTYAIEDALEAAKSHEEAALNYEQKAAAQDTLIAEHQQMKKEYKQRYFINEKVTPISRIQKMEKHCDAIIKDAEELKRDMLDFAKWHRMRAEELRAD